MYSELTGITQDMVKEEDEFVSVFNQFRLWLEDERKLVHPDPKKSYSNGIDNFFNSDLSQYSDIGIGIGIVANHTSINKDSINILEKNIDLYN